jgi:hypothetical protein
LARIGVRRPVGLLRSGRASVHPEIRVWHEESVVNRVFRLVWNRALRATQVASEVAHTARGGVAMGVAAPAPHRRPLVLACLAALAVAVLASPALAATPAPSTVPPPPAPPVATAARLPLEAVESAALVERPRALTVRRVRVLVLPVMALAAVAA